MFLLIFALNFGWIAFHFIIKYYHCSLIRYSDMAKPVFRTLNLEPSGNEKSRQSFDRQSQSPYP